MNIELTFVTLTENMTLEVQCVEFNGVYEVAINLQPTEYASPHSPFPSIQENPQKMQKTLLEPVFGL